VKTDLDEETRPGGAAVPSDNGEAPAANGPAGPAVPSEADGAVEGAVGDEASSFLRGEGESARDYALRIFNRVYVSDIDNVLKMEVRYVCSLL
jgi:hypothetical protein